MTAICNKGYWVSSFGFVFLILGKRRSFCGSLDCLASLLWCVSLTAKRGGGGCGRVC